MKNLVVSLLGVFGLICWCYFVWLYPGVLLLPLGFALLGVAALVVETD